MDKNALESVWTAWNHLEPVSSRCRLLGPMVPFFPGWRNQVFCFQHPTAVHTVDQKARILDVMVPFYWNIAFKWCSHMLEYWWLLYIEMPVLVTSVNLPISGKKKLGIHPENEWKWWPNGSQKSPDLSKNHQGGPLPACTGAGWRCRRPRCGRCGPAEMTTRS